MSEVTAIMLLYRYTVNKDVNIWNCFGECVAHYKVFTFIIIETDINKASMEKIFLRILILLCNYHLSKLHCYYERKPNLYSMISYAYENSAKKGFIHLQCSLFLK
jgi:hypothetical protein